jgi:hypothetical protein
MKLGLHYWNFSIPPPSAAIAPTLAATARVAEQAGVTNPTEVAQKLAEVAEYAALGATEVQIMPDRHPVEFAEQVAERVLTRLSALG